jgi:ABC-type multidrug transport system fused ATPase/permease subunit
MMRLALIIILLIAPAVTASDPAIAALAKQGIEVASAQEKANDAALDSLLGLSRTIRTLEAENASLKDSNNRLPAYVQIGLGAALTTLAAFVLIFGELRTAARLGLVGLLSSTIGYAMLSLGFWYAVIGLGSTVLIIGGAVAWEIRSKQRYRVSAEEIIDANQQAKAVAAQVGDSAWTAIQNAAQSVHTKKLVKSVKGALK